MITPEELASEICPIVSDSTISSYQAAQKVYDHLEKKYQDKVVLFSHHVNSITDIIKQYRTGETLTIVTKKIIDLVETEDLDLMLNVPSAESNQVSINKLIGSLSNFPTISSPILPSIVYPQSVGKIDLTQNVLYAPDSVKWVDCDGKLVDSLLYQDLYNFINQNIPGFDAYVNSFLQSSNSTTSYSYFSTFSGNMQMLFNLPIIKDHSIKVFS